MIIVAQSVPLFTRAVRVCDDDGKPLFVCLVTAKGWFGHIAWVWLGMGHLDAMIRAALIDDITLHGHDIIAFERLKAGSFKPKLYPLKRVTDQPKGPFNWPFFLMGLFWIWVLI